MKQNKINLFFACDDNYIPFLAVTFDSIIKNRSKDNVYKAHVLHAGINENNIKKIKENYTNSFFEVDFVDISNQLLEVSEKLHTRDYYSKSTYYRLFIPSLFPDLDKALYLDCDLILLDDVAKLYKQKLKNNLVGGVADAFVQSIDMLKPYVEKKIGVRNKNYFNAGVLLMNLKELRKFDFKEKFLKLLSLVKFDVAQDQDYLNALCSGRVKMLDKNWNFMPLNGAVKNKHNKLVHFNLDYKPWQKDGILYGEEFWKYAKENPFALEINLTKSKFDQERQSSAKKQTCNLIENAFIQSQNIKENKKIQKIINAIKKIKFNNETCKSPEKLAILQKINELERLGIFDKDVENDPESKTLMPDQINYLNKGILGNVKRFFAFMSATSYFKKALKNKQIIINDPIGIENLSSVEGAIITCNHFNAFDSFVMQYVFKLSKHKKRLYRVIREGNYTGFKGFYGFLMRNCDTLPLSSNTATMKKFYSAVSKALKENNCVLVYPEQSMWWNYRKPKPLKNGAFQMAVKNNVPVVPCFITLEDSEIIGEDGFPVQIYTPHIGNPIYIDPECNRVEAIEKMKEDNFNYCKTIYENFYNLPLEYITEQ